MSGPSLESRTFGAMVAFIQRAQRAAEAALAGSGISPAQYFILAVLERREEVRQVELAEALGVTAGNISQLVGKLEESGFVRRSGDGKAKRVSLTARGKRTVAALRPQHEAFLVDRFAALGLRERRALLGLLERLLEP